MRFATLVCGITFFALFPIGSRFPEYRLLVSPVKWLFWNIPSHGNYLRPVFRSQADKYSAEWSILSLQAEGQRHRDRDTVSSSQSSAEPELAASDPMGYRAPTNANGGYPSPSVVNPEAGTDDYGSYDCSHDNKNGKLILNPLGLYFISSIGHKRHFMLPYENIEKLEKVCLVFYAVDF